MATDFRKDILEAKKIAADAFAKKDISGLLEVFSPDITFMPPGMDAIHGKEALRQQYKQMYEIGAAGIEWEVKEIKPMDCDTVYDRGYVQVLNAKGHTMINGKYLAIWKKVDGKWLAYIDIFNSNA